MPYYIIFSAIGSLMPFIPVYMKQLGLSPTEAGILIGAMPFVSFFVQPVFGAIADKTRKHKLVLICCLILSGISFGSLLLTPRKNDAGSCRLIADVMIGCDVGAVYILDRDCFYCENKTASDILNSHRISESLQEYLRSDSCSLSCNKSITYSEFSHIRFSTNSSVNYRRASTTDSEIKNDANSSVLYNTSEHAVLCDIQHVKTICQISYLKNATNMTQNFENMTCKDDSFMECYVDCYPGHPHECSSENTDGSKTFWIFCVIFFFANIFYTPITSLIDAIAYDILDEKRKLWGKQRLWGTMGFALFAMAGTFIMDIKKQINSSAAADYSVCFYIFIGLCVISALVTVPIDISETLQCKKMLKGIRILLRIPKIVGFLLVIVCSGTLHFVFAGFLFWFLEDIGSNQIILGLCIVMNCFAEVIMLFIAGKIIQRIGHIKCLYIALIAYIVRYLSYSFLTNAWFVLPIELLHGITFGLMYAAASAYASIIAPKGMSATMQGLTSGLYFGFGKYCIDE